MLGSRALFLDRRKLRGISLWSRLHAVPFFRRPAQGRALVVLATLGGAALLMPACIVEYDECLEADARCDGAVAQSCASGERGAHRVNRWYSSDCSDRACVATTDASGRPQAFCALSAQPDARCVEPDGTSCDGKSLLTCRAGRATEITACAAGCIELDDFPDYCRENPPDSVRCVGGDGCELKSPGFSAMSAHAPADACSAAQFGPALDLSTKVYAYSCENGVLTRRDHCRGACLTTPECTTRCAE
jgi:hypothetical protein